MFPYTPEMEFFCCANAAPPEKPRGPRTNNGFETSPGKEY